MLQLFNRQAPFKVILIMVSGVQTFQGCAQFNA
jgi:hypothetical protein